MLTYDNYLKGVTLNEHIKYNIEYDKLPLFDIVCSGLASRLLSYTYADELTEEQRVKLETIKNK